MCPLFKMQSPQVFNLPFEITDTQSEKGGHLRMEEFYFRLIFFARTAVRLSKGQYLHRQSRLHLCVRTVTLKDSYEVLFPGYFSPSVFY